MQSFEINLLGGFHKIILSHNMLDLRVAFIVLVLRAYYQAHRFCKYL
jgi:hypothetical protein